MSDGRETFFAPGAERASKVDALFTRIAPRYDLINDLQSFGLHRLWKRRVIELARLKPGMRALDVCCGTGDLAWGLARGGAEVVGLDFNERMLEEAERRRHNGKLKMENGKTGNVRFMKGDALNLPFEIEEFDIVTVGYGLRNLADWERGLTEMQRVAKPGGGVISLDFGKPDNRLWRSIYFSYLRLCVPVLGRIFCGSTAAYSYILESLQNYPAQRGVGAKMKDMELVNVRTEHLLGGVMGINYGEKRAGTCRI